MQKWSPGRTKARPQHYLLKTCLGHSKARLALLSLILIAVAMLAHGSGSRAQTPPPASTPAAVLTNLGTTYYVDNDSGNDSFDCTAATVAAASPSPNGIVDGPCKSIQHAIDLTRDRDLVVVASQEPLQLTAALRVPDLIGVVAGGFLPGRCTNAFGTSRCADAHCDNVAGGTKVVLQSLYGGPVFRVTAVGGPSLHALIAGFILGGTTNFADPGAVTLDRDAFTELRCNIIGQEDLPNVIGILTKGSEQPFIHDNTVHGSSQFPISAALELTPPIGGFGLVTDECLGGSTRTDQLPLESNLFGFNSNAGVWICSDGSGGHVLRDNNLRSNGRGVVLLSAVDTTLRANSIGDNYYDGVDILEASQNNRLESNQIESQEGPSSTGVLLQGSGVLFPLGNTLIDNQIRRNRVDVLIAGARGTRLTGNSISAIGERTAVLLAIGTTSGAGGRNFAQPSGTVFRSNKIYANGVCTALRGCAIRLLPGVTVPVDASDNDFGVSDPADVQAALWDHSRDPELGPVLSGSLPASGTRAAETTATAAAGARARASATASTPIPLLPSTPSPTAPPPTPSPSATPVASGTPSTGPSAASAAASPSPSPAPDAVPPLAYLDPATNQYYVELTLCVSDALQQPVAGETLSISFFDGAGDALGVAHALTDATGCFQGDAQPAGDRARYQPARLTVVDPTGGELDLDVTLGAPAVRPPRGPVQTG
ncbi:MAG: NosD domain-containing protein [Dehalococcoidia bacterium]